MELERMYLCYVIESEGALAFNVVVSPIIERVVLTDQSLEGRLDTLHPE